MDRQRPKWLTTGSAIRRDFLTGAWIEALNDFRSGGGHSAAQAEIDAERCADRMIEQILEVMDNGQEWLQHRIAACSKAR